MPRLKASLKKWREKLSAGMEIDTVQVEEAIGVALVADIVLRVGEGH